MESTLHCPVCGSRLCEDSAYLVCSFCDFFCKKESNLSQKDLDRMISQKEELSVY